MRIRTSAVMMLVATLLASQVSGFACLFDCETSKPVAVARAESPEDEAGAAGEGSCHRETEEVPVSDVSLSAAPHDCGSHVSAARTLTTPRSISIVSPVSTPDATPVDFTATLTAATATQASPTHDLAPPGAGPRLIAPLRI